MTTTNELKPLLKRLRLGFLLNTLPERLALARRDQLDYAAFLEILLADEVTRRDNRNIEIHLQMAGFEEICRLEDFDWTAQVTVDRRLLDAVFLAAMNTSFSSALSAWANHFWHKHWVMPPYGWVTVSASSGRMLSSARLPNRESITPWRKHYALSLTRICSSSMILDSRSLPLNNPPTFMS